MATNQIIGAKRNPLQNVCFGMGLLFLLLGVIGLVVPGLFKMHLSFLHNVIYIVTAFMAFFSAQSSDPEKSRTFAMMIGLFYGVLAFLGYVVGQPGYPGIGNLSEDQYLLKIIPNVLEFGRRDHAFHLAICAILLFSRFAWRKTARD
jgi:hypothetical protein